MCDQMSSKWQKNMNAIDLWSGLAIITSAIPSYRPDVWHWFSKMLDKEAIFMVLDPYSYFSLVVLVVFKRLLDLKMKDR